MNQEKLAYFLGVLQTDGKLTTYNTIKRNKVYRRTDIGLKVGKKSFQMLKQFQRSLKELYGRDINIHESKDGFFDIHTSVNKLLETFKEQGIGKIGIPDWIKQSESNFGAHLAGVIDGDGNVRVKRPKYPQHMIRISDGKFNEDLLKLINEFMKCKVTTSKNCRFSVFRDGRTTYGRWYDYDICISRKNAIFINKHVLPFMTINYKKELINKGVQQKLN
ncbi:MAG: hypothetical protein KJ697_04695 [Nanoarchaeota archaeon]|nr:hypothetical protein [Nanoarchaeota archaeon]MBU4124372.1 hypothetical protein [Nanoarchaeota archaeon]